MAFSIADLISEEKIILDNATCINISFPGFFDLLKNLMQ
jgi:3-phosphoshikimate 1-carboxyvinyltransferase